MPMVRCPKCGTINPNGRRRLARCRRCQEPLSKCRYCQFYDARLMDCTHPARPEELRIVDPDEVLNCPDFTSTLVVGTAKRRWLVPVLRTGVIAALVGIGAFLGVVRLYRAFTQPPPSVLLRASASAPAVSFLDAGFAVKILVLNEAEHPARDVQVFIRGPTVAHLVCQSVDPPEAFVEASPQMVCGWLGDLAPGEIGSVEFQFVADEPGELQLVGQVTAANVPGPQRVPIEGEIVP